jgi:transcriptional regulator with XRE-family HTH domain
MAKLHIWKENGNILKNRRISAKLLLRDAAKYLGINAIELSNMETGKVEPDMNINYIPIIILRTVYNVG